MSDALNTSLSPSSGKSHCQRRKVVRPQSIALMLASNFELRIPAKRRALLSFLACRLLIPLLLLSETQFGILAGMTVLQWVHGIVPDFPGCAVGASTLDQARGHS
jgi:hypothetical protein